MMKIFLLLMLFVVHTCTAQEKLQLSVASGYGQQNLRWSIAGDGNGQNPNILSELKWQNVSGIVTVGRIQWNFLNRWMLEGEYERMFFSSGKVSDTDYGSDGRNDVVYAGNFNAGKKGSDRWITGIGYRIPVTNKFSITPSAGYGMFHQLLCAYDNSNLDSKYKTKWIGPYAQVSGSIEITKKLSADVNLRYNQVQYNASADWNVNPMFNHPESFRHTANGYGITSQASLRIYSFGIKGSYSHWQTGRGIDELYLANGESQQTQLNEVRSSGWQLMVEWRINLRLRQ